MPGPELKLYYFVDDKFVYRARAEICRILLAYAKRDYEFVPVTIPMWENDGEFNKKKFVYSRLPVLEMDGKQYGQALAIASFLAAEAGIYGASPFENLVIDGIAQLREDLLRKEVVLFYEENEEKKAALDKDLKEKIYPAFLGYFSKILKDNGTGYAVGNRLTLADLVVYEAFTTMTQSHPELLEGFPEIVALRHRVQEVEGIKQFLETRPKAPL